jgi:hypothetical protein
LKDRHSNGHIGQRVLRMQSPENSFLFQQSASRSMEDPFPPPTGAQNLSTENSFLFEERAIVSTENPFLFLESANLPTENSFPFLESANLSTENSFPFLESANLSKENSFPSLESGKLTTENPFLPTKSANLSGSRVLRSRRNGLPGSQQRRRMTRLSGPARYQTGPNCLSA